jgi:hypothetical protein
MTDWSKEFPIEGPPEAAQVMLGVQCTDMPLGGAVWFSVPGGETPDGERWEPVESPRMTIANPDQVVAIRVAWPAGVKTEMTINYSGPEPSPGSAIEPIIGVELSVEESELEAGAVSWPQEFPVPGPTEAGSVAIGLRCSQIPEKSKVRFTTPGGGGVAPLDSGERTVQNSEESYLLQQEWPANYSTTLKVWLTPAGEVPAGAGLVLRAARVINKGTYYELETFWSKKIPAS